MEGKNLRRIGNSELYVSPIGLGCWQFSQGQGFMGRYWKSLNDQEIKAIIEVSLAEGINWFDTAEAYGWGASEHVMAKELDELHKAPQDIIIATKWWPLFRTARSITQSIHKRLASLHPYSIDLYQIHQPLSFSTISSQMKQLTSLLNEGKVRYAGVSNFSAQNMRVAYEELKRQGHFLVSNQVLYNLLNRKIETSGVLETAKELGITIIAYSPLAQGILSGKFHKYPGLVKDISGMRKLLGRYGRKTLKKSQPLINLLEKLSEKYGVTPSQIALKWLIQFHGEVIVAIPGATNNLQAKENATAMNFTLSREDLDTIDTATQQFK